MLCSKCGKEVTEGAAFCPFCAEPVNAQTAGAPEVAPGYVPPAPASETPAQGYVPPTPAPEAPAPEMPAQNYAPSAPAPEVPAPASEAPVQGYVPPAPAPEAPVQGYVPPTPIAETPVPNYTPPAAPVGGTTPTMGYVPPAPAPGYVPPAASPGGPGFGVPGGGYGVPGGGDGNWNMPKKKSPVGMIIAIVAAVVILLGVVGILARDAIMLAISPRSYVVNAFESTTKQITRELNASQEARGAKIDFKESFTQEIGLKIDSITMGSTTRDINTKLDLGLYYSKEKKQYILQGELDFRGNKLISANAFADAKEAGINIPELYDVYLTMPTELGDMLDGKLELTEETKMILEKEGKELSKAIEVGDVSKEKVTISGKEQSVRKINVTVPGEALNKYCKAAVAAFKDDENLKKAFGGDVLNDIIEEMEYSIDDIDSSDEIALELWKYKKNFIKMSVNINDESTISCAFLGEKNLIDSVEIVVDDGYDKATLKTEGKHVPEGNIYSDKTTFKSGDVTIESTQEIDYGKTTGNISGEIKMNASGDTISVSYSGDCDKSGGGSMNLSKLEASMKSSGTTYSIKGSLTSKSAVGDSGKTIESISRKDTTNMTSQELDSYISFDSVKGMKLQEELTKAVLYIMTGSDSLGGFGGYSGSGYEPYDDSYYDDYSDYDSLLY